MERKFLFILVVILLMAKNVTAANQQSDGFDRVQVAAGATHSMALSADGSLWVWGENTFGQIGNGRVTVYGNDFQIVENHDAYTPVRIMDGIVDIAAGYGFSLAVNEQGELFSWGVNDRGQLGDGTDVNRHTPEKIMDDVAFVDANSNGSFAVAVKTDGSLWFWGLVPTDFSHVEPLPVQVAENVRDASAGIRHIMLLTNDNRLYGMGQMTLMGRGNIGQNTFAVDPVFIMSDVYQIATGRQQSYALTSEGTLYGWGANGFDRSVGTGSEEFWIYYPEFVMENVRAVFPGNMLLCNENSLWAWGGIHDFTDIRATDENGQGRDMGGSMGMQIVLYGSKPVRVLDNVLTASRGSHVLAVDRDLNLFSWGANQFGQLGTGTANSYHTEEYEDCEDIYDRVLRITTDKNAATPIHIGNTAAIPQNSVNK